ncbi:hypothetical protein L1887_61766 [Cichorium endivia]|nr:hypothetical protein L1887_61766 [Cichorium endivia]
MGVGSLLERLAAARSVDAPEDGLVFGVRLDVQGALVGGGARRNDTGEAAVVVFERIGKGVELVAPVVVPAVVRAVVELVRDRRQVELQERCDPLADPRILVRAHHRGAACLVSLELLSPLLRLGFVVVESDANTRVTGGGPAQVSAPVDDRREPDSVGDLVLELGQLHGAIHLAILHVLDAKPLAHHLILDVRAQLGVGLVGGEPLGRLGCEELGRVRSVEQHIRIPAVERLFVLAPLQTQRQSSALVVRHREDHRLGLVRVVGSVGVHPLHHRLHHLVVRQDVVDVADGIVVVRSVVDACALDHNEIRLARVAQAVERGERHLLEARLGGSIAVDLIGHVRGSKERHGRQLERLPALERIKLAAVVDHVESVLLGFFHKVPAVGTNAGLGGVGEKVTQSSTPQDVGLTTEHVVTDLLARNFVLGVAVIDVRRVGGGCGVSDPRGGHERRVVALGLGPLEHRSARLLVRVDADVGIDALEAARRARGQDEELLLVMQESQSSGRKHGLYMVCFGTRRVGRSSSALCTVHHYLHPPHPSGDQKARCSLRTKQASARLGTGAHCARVYCRTDGPFARHLPRIAARLVWAKRGRGVARAPQLGLGTAARPTEGIFGISKCTPTGGKHVPAAFASSTTAAAALSGVTQRWKFGSSHPSEGCCPSEALRGSWRWRHLDGQREK